MKPRTSLQRLITLSILLLGLFFGTVGLGFAYWHARQLLRDTIGQSFLELARQGADKLGLVLGREIEWIERLATLPEVSESVQDRTRLTLQSPRIRAWREEQERYFRTLVLIDRQGQLVGSFSAETTQAHYQRQVWWPVVFQEGRAWSGPITSDEEGRSSWEVVVPIRTHQGMIVGALKVAVDTDRVLGAVLRARLGETGHLMLLTAEGRMLACPLFAPRLHRTVRLPQEAEAAVLLWPPDAEDSHGEPGAMVATAPINLPATVVQEQPWYVLVRQDPAETDAPALRLLGRLAWFWVAVLALVLVGGRKLARRLVQPIEGLIERIRAVGEGTPVPPMDLRLAERVEEVEALMQGVNVMAERLEAASRETTRYVGALEKTNRELTESEAHYRALWNSSVDANLIVDATGAIRQVNRRVQSKVGRSAEDLVGRPALELFVEADRHRVDGQLRGVLATRQESALFEAAVPTASGETLTVEVNLVPLESSAPVKHVLLQLSDVTDQKRLEQQLVRSERLASLSQFASMFAHDIRNPLAGIKKTLEVMARCEEARHPAIRPLLDDLQFTTQLLLGMINDMLDVYQDSYSGIPLLRTRFSMIEMLEEVVRLFHSEAAARNVAVRVEALEGDVEVSGDRRRLQRVWINLVHNALKYSCSPGRIILRVKKDSESASGVDPEPSEPRLVRVEVHDEGPGVDPADLPHLFEMFFRKKDGSDWRIGRGLGLHFCRLVVEAHRGRITAANRAGGGAVFSVILPCQEAVGCPSGS